MQSPDYDAMILGTPAVSVHCRHKDMNKNSMLQLQPVNLNNNQYVERGDSFYDTACRTAQKDKITVWAILTGPAVALLVDSSNPRT